MFWFILAFYLFFCVLYRKNKVLLTLFILQVISVLCAIIINLDSYSDDSKTFYNVAYILVSTLMLILPWKKYGEMTVLLEEDRRRVDTLTNVLLVISSFTFIVLAIVAVVAQIYIGNAYINDFKDETTHFYYNMLPFDVHWYLLARILYTFSYFLIPLHFYHLFVGNKTKSNWCAVLSLNIVLYGLAFFSRWTIMLFVCLYLVMWFIFRKVMPEREAKREKKAIVIIFASLLLIFSAITLGRFASDDGVSTRYSERIPMESPIQDPATYSILDYMGQSNSIGIYLLNKYQGQHFGFKYPLMSIQTLLAGIGLSGPSDVYELHEKHWGSMWDKFPGFTVYGVYDVGYVLAFFFCVVYFLIVYKRRTTFRLHNLLTAVVLIQMPICSIYYSQASAVLYSLLFYLPIWLFLNGGNTKGKRSRAR